MKATVLMHQYLVTSPMVLAINSVKDDALRFKAAYNSVRNYYKDAFSYVGFLGGEEELHHKKFPDLYYYAVRHYSTSGALGSEGRFLKTQIQTVTSTKILDKYRDLSKETAPLDVASIQRWRAALTELGITPGAGAEEALTKALRKLEPRRKSHDSFDDEETGALEGAHRRARQDSEKKKKSDTVMEEVENNM